MKERVLIVSKTRMNQGVCVGGLVSKTYQNVRLLQPDGSNQSQDTEYDIGDVWELEITPLAHTLPPHVEDVLVQEQIYKCHIPEIRQLLLERIQPWEGCPENLYNGLLQYTHNGGGYICEWTGIPNQSVGFWIIPDTLRLTYGYNNKIRYVLDNHILSMPYVGLTPTVESLPVGTLVRLSLARWWRPEQSAEEKRCYLQLSGWY